MISAAFDLEANGLINYDVAQSEYQPSIIEFGGMRSDGQSLKCLIKPPTPIIPEVEKITQITNEMVKDESSFRVVFPSIVLFFKGVDMLFTYNGMGYDLPVMMHNLIANGLQYQFPWPVRHIDIMLAATDYMGMKGKTGNKYPKLSELHEFLFKEKFEDSHRALPDAVATMRCAKELIKRKVVRL